MPITPTNLTKHTITPGRVDKSGYATWADSVVAWDSSSLFWDSPLNAFAMNLSKHTITPTNQVKH
jgi:hypothetical protein